MLLCAKKKIKMLNKNGIRGYVSGNLMIKMWTNNAKYKHKVVGDTVTSQVIAYETEQPCPESKIIASYQITC